jgi:flagellar FliJ protein
MENYKFRLQKLLDIKVDLEDESKRRFKEAQDAKSRVELKLEELNVNYKKYNNINNQSSLVEKKIVLNYLEALNSSIVYTNEELKYKTNILDEKREDLKQKLVERKTVEVLKEKGKQIFIKEQNFIEQKSNDEFALYGFIRNRRR